MSFFSKKIKEVKKTQVLAKNLILDELIKDNIIKELKKKFSEEGEIVTTYIRFHLIPRKKPSSKIDIKKLKDAELVIKSIPIDSVTLEHPSPEHFKNKTVTITSNKNKILDKLLK